MMHGIVSFENGSNFCYANGNCYIWITAWYHNFLNLLNQEFACLKTMGKYMLYNSGCAKYVNFFKPPIYICNKIDTGYNI